MPKQTRLDTNGLPLRAFSALTATLFGLLLAGCGQQMARIEDNQIRLQAMLEAHAQQTGTIAAHIEQDQQELHAGIQAVQKDAQAVGVQVAAVGDQQSKFRQMVDDNQRLMASEMTVVQQNQQRLLGEIKNAQAGTAQVAADVAAVGIEQIKLKQAMAQTDQQLATMATTIQRDQQELRAAVADVRDGTTKVAAEVAKVGDTQTSFQQMLAKSSLDVVARLLALEQNQHKLQTGVLDIQNAAQKAAVDITAVSNEQTKLHEMVLGNSRTLGETAAAIRQEHLQLLGGVKELQSSADKAGAQIAKVENTQGILLEALASGNRELTAGIGAVEQNQQKLRDGISGIRSIAQKVADDIAGFASGQTTLEQLITNNSLQLIEKVTAAEQRQQQSAAEAEGLRQNVQQVAETIGGLEQSLLKLQEIVERGMHELASTIDAAGRQLGSQEKTEKDIEAIFVSINAIKQALADVQRQVTEATGNGAAMDSIVTAIEQLKAEATEAAPAGSVEPAVPATEPVQ